MMPCRNIAEMLSLPESTVRYRVQRGREEIRKMLYSSSSANGGQTTQGLRPTEDELRQYDAVCTYNMMHNGEVPY